MARWFGVLLIRLIGHKTQQSFADFTLPVGKRVRDFLINRRGVLPAPRQKGASMFQIIGDEIVYDGKTIGRITIKPGSLRERVEMLLKYCVPK